MVKLIRIFILFYCFFLTSCSFDTKTGIWTGNFKEIRSEKKGKVRKLNFLSNTETFEEEISNKVQILLDEPSSVNSWFSSNLNNQNNIAHINYNGNLNIFFKDKLGKNKFKYITTKIPIISFDNAIFLSDRNGTIFKIDQSGNLSWKRNIYKKLKKKINKKIHKKLSYTYFNKNIYIADNLGFLYSVNSNTGNINWIKNFPDKFNSSIKIANNSIYLLSKENKLFSVSLKDGSINGILSTDKAFISSNKELALALSNDGNVFFINSIGDLYKVNPAKNSILWSMPTINNLAEDKTDFFETSDIVIYENTAFFSNLYEGTYAIDIKNGAPLWKLNFKTNIRQIVNKNHVFLLTSNGYLINVKKESGIANWSVNLYKNLKKKHHDVKFNNFILASSKIYVSTNNGYLLICSTQNGKVEKIVKLGKSINNFIISKDNLYVLTNKSKLFGLN